MINLPIATVSVVNSCIWFTFAFLTQDLFFAVSQGLAVLFNGIQLLFFYWATDVINDIEYPGLMNLINYLILFFKIFMSTKLAKTDFSKVLGLGGSAFAAKPSIKTKKQDSSKINRMKQE